MIKEQIMQFFSSKPAIMTASGTAAIALSSVSAFAAETPPPVISGNLSGVAVTTEMLTPLVDGVSANVAVILPIGITLMAIFIGVSCIPRIINRFTKGN